jgi:hypothetical protein
LLLLQLALALQAKALAAAFEKLVKQKSRNGLWRTLPLPPMGWGVLTENHSMDELTKWKKRARVVNEPQPNFRDFLFMR